MPWSVSGRRGALTLSVGGSSVSSVSPVAFEVTGRGHRSTLHAPAPLQIIYDSNILMKGSWRCGWPVRDSVPDPCGGCLGSVYTPSIPRLLHQPHPPPHRHPARLRRVSQVPPVTRMPRCRFELKARPSGARN
ncbi:hypothetical protein SKAU_G00394670 [Synaphobranchus kaupii]|uniref:Uncharacterized protein n=1 Tax=Synaphobranchus kaupii TaxID=118154 RepID=A0A9Q1EC67_SYNKA|nr:hypothetical protein SKAU_G00394670 [Synaphobranchus kaupii]